MSYVVRFYAADADTPSDCAPDFAPTIAAAHATARTLAGFLDWIHTYDIVDMHDRVMSARRTV